MASDFRVGDDISEQYAEELNNGYARYRARKSAASSLAHHNMSGYTVKKKLCNKGFSEEESEEARQWLESKGFINDEGFAEECARYYKARGCGELRIREELKKRGIPRETADNVIDGLGDFREELSSLIFKKTSGKEPDADSKRKLFAFLTRRGFRYDEIKEAFCEMQFNTEDIN